MRVPKFYELMTPVLRAIEILGGEAHIEQLTHEVVKIISPSEKTLKDLQRPGKTRKSRLECLIAYAGKYLCSYGVLERVAVDTWRITEKFVPGMNVTHDDIIQAALNKART